MFGEHQAVSGGPVVFHFNEFVINISNKMNINIKAFILHFEKELIFTSTFYFHKRKFGMLNVHYPAFLLAFLDEFLANNCYSMYVIGFHGISMSNILNSVHRKAFFSSKLIQCFHSKYLANIFLH